MNGFPRNLAELSSPVEELLLRQLNAEINYSEKYDPDPVTRRAVNFLRRLRRKTGGRDADSDLWTLEALRVGKMSLPVGVGTYLSRIFCGREERRTVAFIERLSAESVPVFLCAQGLGPFGGVAETLDAFDRLWSSGVDARLIVLGDSRPFGRIIESRIRNHPRYGKDIFWLRAVTRQEWSTLVAQCFLLLGACGMRDDDGHLAHKGLQLCFPAETPGTDTRILLFDILHPDTIDEKITEILHHYETKFDLSGRSESMYAELIDKFLDAQHSVFRELAQKISDPSIYRDPNPAIRVRQYLLASVFAEAMLRENERLGRFARFIYDECRNFYWTCERILRAMRLGKAEPPPVRRRYPDWIDAIREAPANNDGIRYLVDVTPTLLNELRTGIQRVVREVSARIAADGRGYAVSMRDGELFSWRPDTATFEKIVPRAGDRLLILDAGWLMVDEYKTAVQAAKNQGVETIVCLYDLFPLNFAAVFPFAVQQSFLRWFNEVIVSCDCVAAISRTVADDYFRYCVDNRSEVKSGQQVVVWSLGADFTATKRQQATPRSEKLIKAGRPYFISVGTLGVTKGHAFILDVFEGLWAAGADIACLIVGRPGWGTRALQARIWSHPEFGRRLFWFPDASDAELTSLYSHAHGLICASLVEGFGLPLVEGIAMGLPVLASDIPIFREVGAQDVYFFDLLDRGSLAKLIESDLKPPAERHVAGVLSWRDATRQLLATLEKVQ
jgi:glycosyltransferase involved in cell wall biosynthesis